ncbi:MULTISPECIES: aminotransferase class IV [Nosocomiicoccus]|uniref:Aminotransferase class IV n=1 Tax=Nosocomiicoccus massiliensis TaxID=1232430 RepID=A0AAF1BME1_9STAP|nr:MULTISPECIES: aminotransferase class IV [Nosocomiicoccus]MDK6864034.1 aminotransferase class IV [Nosocomiicoccus ampullae]OFL48778.1 hypothetical protein HMPREF2767_07160 [Nosocomiicoccus sp. HMSC067E10]OFO55900.1 hypothetical protein HMPREF3029_00440 [Nosocomiicoccus sp. HMSC059G07]WOS95944.1 aminotransferase class IV [Nosocomiicoccus massiliensis]
MTELIETMRLEDGVVKRLDYHNRRINRSAEVFHLNKIDLKEAVNSYVKIHNLNQGVYRIRALYNNDLTLMHDKLEETTEITANVIQMDCTETKWLKHKTTKREQYKTSEYPFALYYDKTERITEFNIGNLVVKTHDGYFTPSKSGLLNGVMRQFLLDNGTISVRDFTLDELTERYNNNEITIYLINSLREWVKVNLQV